MAENSDIKFDIKDGLARELNLAERSVGAVIALLADGNTVPFIARYRKEATGNLDEVQIRTIDERRTYMLELHERRQTCLATVAEQGKLNDELKRRFLACTTKAALEDLYLPFKPKRRSRALLAKSRGLEPLAMRLLAQPVDGDIGKETQAFLGPGHDSPEAAMAGARDIVAELAAENAEIRAAAREAFAEEGLLVSERIPENTTEPSKFEQYYQFSEKASHIPSHRFLALRRGERENILRVRLELDAERVLPIMRRIYPKTDGSPYADHLEQALQDGYKRLLAPSIATDVRVDLKLRADREAVEVFASNLQNLLLAAPLGNQSVIGVDPGLRTGCKCVALSATGKFLENLTVYLAAGPQARKQAESELLALLARHRPQYVAVGNGTGSREAGQFVRSLLTANSLQHVIMVSVSEAGASVYSASDAARAEFPDIDLTVRGAISIGRRLQDPLAELVKIDPKAIGVGQYQHDVHQPMLQRKLEDVVESCVNHVGVELNTASSSLLARVAGVGPILAKKIVAFRDEHGAFATRSQLLDVGGLGRRTFEQAAGFLRVRGGSHPLDASAVHPERYALVATIAADLHVELKDLVGNAALAQTINASRYANEAVGLLTLQDILSELCKPGRDPRAEFAAPGFRDDIFEIAHLEVGMDFEGVVSNVTAFGAFVDIGVHQDGLVHISELSTNFIKDPKDIVKVGDKLRVTVLSVDLQRKRISLSAKAKLPKPVPAAKSVPLAADPRKAKKAAPQRSEKLANNPFAQLKNSRN